MVTITGEVGGSTFTLSFDQEVTGTPWAIEPVRRQFGQFVQITPGQYGEVSNETPWSFLGAVIEGLHEFGTVNARYVGLAPVAPASTAPADAQF